jgi:hypothetical protein
VAFFIATLAPSHPDLEVAQFGGKLGSGMGDFEACERISYSLNHLFRHTPALSPPRINTIGDLVALNRGETVSSVRQEVRVASLVVRKSFTSFPSELSCIFNTYKIAPTRNSFPRSTKYI